MTPAWASVRLPWWAPFYVAAFETLRRVQRRGP